jgi:aminoglycoside phosphotransferase (APT) family kinase protein
MLSPHDADEIAARFALGSDPVLAGPVARGEIGSVWRLTTADGSWAVKEPFEPVDADEVREDAAYQDVLHAAGVALPAVARTPEGEVLAYLVGGAQIRLHGWVDVLERDTNLDPAAVGALLASIHRVHHVGGAPVDPWYTEPVGAARWDELVGALTEADAPFAPPLAEYRDELVAMDALVEPPGELQTCHRDLWADNVRATPDGGLCVLDWEDSGLADPNREVALVLFEFSDVDPARARTLYETYLDGGGPGRVRGRADFSTVIAQIGHITERHCRMWLDPASSVETRAHAADEMAANLARPLTAARMDLLLDACVR